jgi:alkylation response protein AidB-like acyl-CoA dehydrogenase
MDFTYTPEQQALADSAERFCARDYTFEARNALLNGGEGFSRANWAQFAELGWLGAGLSEAAGGFGGGPVETMILSGAFGRALVLEPFLSTAVLALQTLAALPAGKGRDTLVAQVVSGELLMAFAHGEALGRGDETVIHTRFDKGRLTGAKSLVFGAPSADRLLVSARSDAGIGLYLVAADAEGLSGNPYRTLDNQRVADMRLDGVPVLATLAEGADAEAAMAAGYDHATIALCAEAVGAMDAAIVMTRDYLKTRKQFGTTLNTFQALQHRMADMLVELELSRSIVYQGIAALDLPPEQRQRGISSMKAIVSSAAMFVGKNAVQLHGGIGMTEEYAIGHYYRKLYVAASIFGTESLHLKRIAANPHPFWPDIAVSRAMADA